MIKHSVKLTPNEFVFGCVYYVLQLLLVPTILVVINMLLGNPYSEAVINFGYFAINFIVVTLIFHKFLLGNLRIFLEHPWYHLRCAGIGLLMYFAGNPVVSMVILLIDPEFANLNDMTIMEMVQEHFTLMTIGTVLLVPIVEETFYRGMMFRMLFDKHPIAAYGLSMVIFSCVHVAGYIGAADWFTLVLSFFQYLPAGFALAWSYQRSGSIFASVLIHMSVNQVGMLVMR